MIFDSSYYKYFDENEVKNANILNKYYLNIASKIALSSNMKQKHGAIIINKNKIISTGYNYYTINNNLKVFSVHAEVSAIISLKNKHILPDCELYVVRISTLKYNNTIRYSKPCQNCQNIILKYNIKKIYYSTNYEYDNIINIINKNIDKNSNNSDNDDNKR